MKQPQVLWISSIQIVQATESCEKPAPCTTKVTANLYPHTFNACVVRRSQMKISEVQIHN